MEFREAIVGMKGPNIGIRPWAAPEDAKEPKDGEAVRRACGLMGRAQWPITTDKRCLSRSQTFLGGDVKV